MAGYDYAKFVSDFGKRTLRNNQIINNYKSLDIKDNTLSKEKIEEKHYEVTQLINSLFGMLIVPYEKYKYDKGDPHNPNSITEKDLSKTKEYYKIARFIIDLEKKGKLFNSYEDQFIVGSFIRHLRNALAHSGDEGLHFTPVKKEGAIKSIIFYDRDGSKEFCTELSIGKIRELVQIIYDLYKKIENIKEVDDLIEYENNVETKRELMKTNKKWARNFDEIIRLGSKSRKLI